jgi:hypothetical protein
MKSFVTRVLCASAVALAMAGASAQERPAAPQSNDPRVGLKAGLKDAGVAASNMELVANLPKPPGFFDPKAPAGATTEPDDDAPETQKPPA